MFTMKEIIATPDAPKAIGPYSQAVRLHGMVFFSGQIPLHPVTGELVHGTIQMQTERVLENLKAVVQAAGLTMQHVVKTTVFLKNLTDFAAMNETYAKYFGTNPPARSTVEVARLPRDVHIEVDAIAMESGPTGS
ncbi:MAG: RidA family protein [Bryobacteraceae bacterium]